LSFIIPFIFGLCASSWRKILQEEKLYCSVPLVLEVSSENKSKKLSPDPRAEGRWKHTQVVSVLSSVCMAYSTLLRSKKKEQKSRHKCLCEIRNGCRLSGPLRRLEISKMCTDSASSASARLSSMKPNYNGRAASMWALPTMSGKAI